MQLFGKLHKKPAASTTPPPTDLSDIYLVLTLTLGRKSKDEFLDEDDEYHEDEYEYEDIPLMLRSLAAMATANGSSSWTCRLLAREPTSTQSVRGPSCGTPATSW